MRSSARQLERFRAWALPHKHGRRIWSAHRHSAASCATPPATRPGPLRHRRLRYGPLPRDRCGATSWSRRWSCVVCGRRSNRSRRESGATGGVHRERRPASPRCRSATATAVRRGLTNNAEVVIGGRPLPARGDGVDGQHHRRRGRREVVPGDGAVLIGAGISAERSRGGSTRSTTRSPAHLRRVPRVHEPGARARA